jgi:hypothetical protein
MRVVVLSLMVLLVALSGCSALHWGGETAGESPGFRVRGGDLWRPAELKVTSDCNAVIGHAEYQGAAGKDGAPGTRFVLDDTTFGQSASSVVREEPAKLDAISRLQMTQVEYARVTWSGIHDLAAELVPLLKLLALAQFTQTESGLTATLPGGLTIGGRTISGPAEMQEFFRQAAATVEHLAPAPEPGSVPGSASTTRPAGPGDNPAEGSR